MSSTKKADLTKHISGSVNLRELLTSTYPGSRFLHKCASESVKATGKYPTSTIVRTTQEDLEVDSDEDLFTLDSPPKEKTTRAKGNKVILNTKPPKPPKHSVGQFAPRPTLRSTIKGRVQPTRQKTYAIKAETSSTPYEETPPEGFANNKVGFEPNNIRHAQAHVTWPVWKAAMDKEVTGLLARGTWVQVHRSQVPANVKIMGSQFIFKDKFSGAKARLVVWGDQQFPKPGKHLTFSPTPSATEFRMICALATQRGQPIHSCDIVQAFTQSN